MHRSGADRTEGRYTARRPRYNPRGRLHRYWLAGHFRRRRRLRSVGSLRTRDRTDRQAAFHSRIRPHYIVVLHCTRDRMHRNARHGIGYLRRCLRRDARRHFRIGGWVRSRVYLRTRCRESPWRYKPAPACPCFCPAHRVTSLQRCRHSAGTYARVDSPNITPVHASSS